MATIVSNQKGEQPTENKESQIINSGGEKATDELNNIKLLTKTEFDKLSDEEKKKYTRYNPSLQSEIYGQWLAQQALISQYYAKIGPTVNQIGPLADQLYGKLGKMGIQKMMDAFKPVIKKVEKVDSTLQSVKDLSEAEIIGVLAKPVYDLFSTAFMLIASMALSWYAQIQNPLNMIKAAKQAFDEIDWEGMEDTGKALMEGGSETPSMEVLNQKMSKMVIPDAEMKKLVDEQTKKSTTDLLVAEAKAKYSKKMHETIIAIDKAYDSYEEVKEFMATMGLSTIANTVFDNAFDKLTVDYDELKRMIKEDANDEYNKKAKDMAGNTNKFVGMMKNNIKYIKNSDLDILKKAEQQIKEQEKQEEEKKEQEDSKNNA